MNHSDSFSARKLSRKRAILTYVFSYHQINYMVPTITEISDELNLSYATVWRLIHEMYEDGTLIPPANSTSKHRAYRIPIPVKIYPL